MLLIRRVCDRCLIRPCIEQTLENFVVEYFLAVNLSCLNKTNQIFNNSFLLNFIKHDLIIIFRCILFKTLFYLIESFQEEKLFNKKEFDV